MTRPNVAHAVYLKVAQKGLDECWPWQGRFSYHGYGVWELQNKTWFAHRLIYELENGPVPDGMEVMHTCLNRWCCNSAHLQAGTHAENMKTRKSKLSKEQIEAIKASPENQYYLASKYGVNQATISRIKNHSRFYKNG